MADSNTNLKVFAGSISLAPTSPNHEKMVRNIVGGIAETCPMELLIELATAVYKFRAKELKDEADSN